MDGSRSHWRAPQWAAWLSTVPIPVLPSTKRAFADFGSDVPSPVALVPLLIDDPLLVILVLVEAERRRSHSRISRGATTFMSAVMQLGSDALSLVVAEAPEARSDPGSTLCLERASVAARCCSLWGRMRSDRSPDELCCAAVCADLGELLLRQDEPELPALCDAALASGRCSRNRDAQIAVAGFPFKDLSVELASRWNLPDLVVQLISDPRSPRAALVKRAVELSRHVCAGSSGVPALRHDLRALSQLLPGVPLEEACAPLPIPRMVFDNIVATLDEESLTDGSWHRR